VDYLIVFMWVAEPGAVNWLTGYFFLNWLKF